MGVILWLVIVVGILASVVGILAVWMLQKRKKVRI